MEDDVKTINDYLDILKRRKWALIIPACAMFFLALIVAFTLSPTYRSTATILIEEQELPIDFVRTTITGYAEQRLQSLNQRIMSSTKLLEIINRFNLYEQLRKKISTEEIVDIMRKDIKFSTISADIVDPQRGSAPAPMTIAFTLSYDGKKPQAVQQVANVLASLFLEENLKVREEKTLSASTFLNEEAKSVQKQLADMDGRIAEYKSKHVNELPELLSTNLLIVDRTERDLEMLKQHLITQKESEAYYQTQLSAIPLVNQDRILLKELKAKLVQLESKYSDKHPDVKKMRAEIAELEKRVEAQISKNGPDENLRALNESDNPAYIEFASRLKSVRADMTTTQRQIDELTKKRDENYRRIAASPGVEESYKTLLGERNNLQLKYDDLVKKAMEAKVAQGLEKEKLGERFTIIDPPRYPEKPVKPNVPAILLIGLFLGIGAGVGTVALQEFNDRSVRDPKRLAVMTNLPVLVAVPEIITGKDILHREQLKRRIIIVAIGVCILGLVLFHFCVMDLDILWAKVARRYL